MKKPRTASGYDTQQTSLVRATCLYVATKLGDLVDDVIVVGGLVPSLIIEQADEIEKHVGTMDLDIGLQIALLDDKRYEALTDRLESAGFGPDTNEKGVRTRQRWKLDKPRVTVDFLIPPSRPGDRGGALRDIEPDFAAIIAPGLRLAFIDAIVVTLIGETIRGEEAKREIRVCGAAAFVVMKSIALRLRGENKDAYDIVYVARNVDGGIAALAERLRTLSAEPEVREALGYLRDDFASINSIGPRRYSEFLFDTIEDNACADAWSALRTLLDQVQE